MYCQFLEPCTRSRNWESQVLGCEFWTGPGPGTDFHHFWEELGAVQGRNIIHQDEWSRVEGVGGKVLIF